MTAGTGSPRKKHLYIAVLLGFLLLIPAARYAVKLAKTYRFHCSHALFDLRAIHILETHPDTKWLTGVDGSLLYKADLECLERQWPYQKNARTISSFNKYFSAMGIRLYVVPVPSKVHIYPETYVGAGRNLDPLRDSFLQALQDSGVETIDLYPLLNGLHDSVQLYATYNDHWNPVAIRFCAEEICRRLVISAPSVRYDTQFVHTWDKNLHSETVVAQLPSLQGTDSANILIIGDSYSYFWMEYGCDLSRYIPGSKRLPLYLGIEGPGIMKRMKPAYFKKYQTIVWVFAERCLADYFLTDLEIGVPEE